MLKENRERSHLSDAALNDELGAFVARKERHVNRAAFDPLGVLVYDGVHLYARTRDVSGQR